MIVNHGGKSYDTSEARGPASVLKGVVSRLGALRRRMRVREPAKVLIPQPIPLPRREPNRGRDAADAAYYRNAWENT